MIQPYQFDDKNELGNKERRLTQDTSLINKLSAQETNKFKDKINEVIVKINEITSSPFNIFKFIQKGFGNTDENNFEIGDIFGGWSNDGTVRIHEALYLGGSLNNSDNFTSLTQTLL